MLDENKRMPGEQLITVKPETLYRDFKFQRLQRTKIDLFFKDFIKIYINLFLCSKLVTAHPNQHRERFRCRRAHLAAVHLAIL